MRLLLLGFVLAGLWLAAAQAQSADEPDRREQRFPFQAAWMGNPLQCERPDIRLQRFCIEEGTILASRVDISAQAGLRAEAAIRSADRTCVTLEISLTHDHVNPRPPLPNCVGGQPSIAGDVVVERSAQDN